MKTATTPVASHNNPSIETWSYSDNPILDPKDDRLNRLPFAKQIAELTIPTRATHKSSGYMERGEKEKLPS